VTAPRAGAAALAAALLLAPALVAATEPPGIGDVTAEDRAAALFRLDPAAAVLALDPAAWIHPMEREEASGSTTTVTVEADVLFAFDEAELADDARGRLSGIADRLRGATGTVQVIGYSDGLGEDDYNQELSERRAEAVRDALTEELGADAPEFEAVGRGATEPVAQETTPDGSDLPAGRSQNRRVEIVFDGA
jgi:outer membrane protein OmpA-like peptidoglycan-associated protein